MDYNACMSKSQKNWEYEDDLAVRYSRDLSLRVLANATSGHPGATLSLMPIFYAMYAKILVHNPINPHWHSRDRFIVSCGHASLALYIQLHLSGYSISEEDLFKFRTLGSITPGHPEFGITPGVEVSTGPLGQGFAMAVGVALSQKLDSKQPISTETNSPNTFVIFSDGDLQEGITLESISIAANYDLDNLIAIYDSNGISIDGKAAFPKLYDAQTIFEGHGWFVKKVGKGSSGDVDIENFITTIQESKRFSQPTLIIIETEIGWPAPNSKGKAVIHGNLLSKEETELTRRFLKFPSEELPKIKETVLEHYRSQIFFRLAHTKRTYLGDCDLNLNYLKSILQELEFPDSISTRKANGLIIKHLQAKYRLLVGGSADLTESNSLSLENQFIPSSIFSNEQNGSNLQFGIREHAMAAIINGLALNRNIYPFGATYLVFSDYQKPAIRLAALMNVPSIFVWTHDSIAIGADGPTHQPIEQLAMLRATPNFCVARPASAEELRSIWEVILDKRGPVGLVLSRQDLPNPKLKTALARNAKYGAYVYHETFVEGLPEAIIIATGSELELAYQASIRPELSHLKIRVVSMPSQELFLEQSEEFKEGVLPRNVVKRVSIESASTFGWNSFVGQGKSIGINEFGLSAPGEDLLAYFKITIDNIVSQILVQC